MTTISNRHSAGNIVFFIALLATAIALGGALAHALELPNKIGLSQDAYFTVQGIYAGWNRLAWVLLLELIGIIGVIVAYWREPPVLRPAIIALACLVAAQIIFWSLTFPANAATSNWTIRPDNWAVLRDQWEYSHLAGAFFQLAAMIALIVAVLRRRVSL